MARKKRQRLAYVDPLVESVRNESWDELWAAALADFQVENYRDAIIRFRDAVTRSAAFEGEDLRKADSRFMLAFSLFLEFEMEEVEQLFLDSLGLRMAHLGPNHPLVALTLQRLGDYYQAVGDWDEAEKSLHSAVLLLDLLGDQYQDSFHKAQILKSLAAPLVSTGQFLEAREHLLRALSLLESETTEASKNLLVIVHTELANVSLSLMDYPSAQAHMEMVVSRQGEASLPDPSLLGSACQVLGEYCAKQGDYERADSLLEKARTIFQSNSETLVPTDLLESLATVRACLGKLDAALDLWTELSAIRQEQGLLLDAAAALENATWAHIQSGRLNLAEDTAATALGILEAEEDTPECRAVQASLIRALGHIDLAQERLAQALERFTRCVTLAAPRSKGEEPTTSHARALCDLGATQMALGSLAEARDTLLESLLIQSGCLPPDDNTKVNAMEHLVLVFHSSGQPDQAADMARHLLIVHQTIDSELLEVFKVNCLISWMSAAAGRSDDCRRYAEQTMRQIQANPELAVSGQPWLQNMTRLLREHHQEELAAWIEDQIANVFLDGSDSDERGDS